MLIQYLHAHTYCSLLSFAAVGQVDSVMHCDRPQQLPECFTDGTFAVGVLEYVSIYDDISYGEKHSPLIFPSGIFQY